MFPFTHISQWISQLWYRLGRSFRSPDAWGTKSLHLLIIFALLLPYVPALASIAADRDASIIVSLGGGGLLWVTIWLPLAGMIKKNITA